MSEFLNKWGLAIIALIPIILLIGVIGWALYGFLLYAY